MRVTLRMASVQYVHTQRFQAEVVSFIQHFTQLQDVLGRQRAAIEGQTVCLGFCRGFPGLFVQTEMQYKVDFDALAQQVEMMAGFRVLVGDGSYLKGI